MIHNLTIVYCLVFAQVPLSPAPRLSIKNTYGEPLSVWFQSQATNQWILPPLLIPRTDTEEITVENPGKHYLVIRDQGRRDERLGWYDLRRIAETAPGGVVYLDSITQYQTAIQTRTSVRNEWRQLCYTICKPVWETRTKLVQFTDPYTGLTYEEIVNYKVCKMVPEQRMRTVEVKVPYTEQVEVETPIKTPALKVMVSGKLILLDEFLQRQQ